MIHRHAHTLYVGAAAAARFAGPVYAQETPATAAPADTQASDDNGGDIVVTARRREETLLTVPIAVTAITGDTLEKTGAVDLTDVQTISPNTTLKDARGTNSTLAAFIRGVGQQDPVPGFEAGIGINLGGVFLSRPRAAVRAFCGVDRIAGALERLRLQFRPQLSERRCLGRRTVDGGDCQAQPELHAAGDQRMAQGSQLHPDRLRRDAVGRWRRARGLSQRTDQPGIPAALFAPC